MIAALPPTWGLALWRLYEYILIDITLLSDISNLRIKPSYRIYCHLHIFDQQHIRADVTRNIATTPSPGRYLPAFGYITIMKETLIFAFFFSSSISFGQTKLYTARNFQTSKYVGIYSYGKNIEKSRIGTIFVFAETDTTILFYIDLNRGAPSYNMGSLYGRVKIINGSGIFSTLLDSSSKGCKWTFLFSKNRLTIQTIDEQDNCGFGYAVFADEVYKRTSNKTISYFEDMEGRKIYFTQTKPEDYYKEQ